MIAHRRGRVIVIDETMPARRLIRLTPRVACAPAKPAVVAPYAAQPDGGTVI